MIPFPIDPIIPLAKGLLNPVGSLTNDAVNSVLGQVGKWVAQGTSWMLSQLAGGLSQAVSPQLSAAAFTEHLRVIATLSATVMVPLLLVAVVQAMIHQDLSGLFRLVVVRVPAAILLSITAVQMVQLGLSLTDYASNEVANAAGFPPEQVLSQLGDNLTNAPSDWPTFAALCIGVLLFVGAIMLWLELMVRSAAITAAALFLPLVLAASIWPVTAAWARRLAETLVALILSKLVIVAVLATGTSMVVAADGSATIGGLVAGAALIVLATFCPFALLRLVPFVEAGAIAQFEGMAQRGLASANRLRGKLPSSNPVDPDAEALSSLPGPEGSWPNGPPKARGDMPFSELLAQINSYETKDDISGAQPGGDGQDDDNG